MSNPSIQQVAVRRNGVADSDFVAVEEPLEIRLGQLSLLVVMRTPGHDEELAAGLLWTEGIISRPEQILDIRHCADAEDASPGNVIVIDLAADTVIDAERLRRSIYASSSCGVCGKASIDAVRQRIVPLRDQFIVERSVLQSLPAAMRQAQTVFSATGGLHAAALFDQRGGLLCLREDVGRHNAVDKVIGWAINEGRTPLNDCLLLVSGRAGFEITQKACVAGIPLLAAVSAPSSLAVQMACEAGLTLIGFLRGDSMNIYSAPQRVV